MITQLLRQNDIATSFCRNNCIIITACVRWDLKISRARSYIIPFRDINCKVYRMDAQATKIVGEYSSFPHIQ